MPSARNSWLSLLVKAGRLTTDYCFARGLRDATQKQQRLPAITGEYHLHAAVLCRGNPDHATPGLVSIGTSRALTTLDAGVLFTDTLSRCATVSSYFARLSAVPRLADIGTRLETALPFYAELGGRPLARLTHEPAMRPW